MEYSQYIIRVQPKLITLTSCDEMIISECRSKKIINDRTSAALNAEKNEITRNTIFWDKIVTQKNCVEKLIRIFDKYCQTPVADILRKATLNPESEESAEEETDDAGTAKVSKGVAMKEKAGNQEITPSSSASDKVDGLLGCLKGERPSIDDLHNVDPKHVIPVKVARPQKKMDFGDKDDYKLPHGIKGLALILNILQFTNGYYNRYGGAVDTANLKPLFEQLGYEVVIRSDSEEDITKQKLKKIIEGFKIQCIQKDVKSFIVFLGSHGEIAQLKMADGKLIGIYSKIVAKLCSTPEGFPNWSKIPKIFFVQACQQIPDTDTTQENIDNCVVHFSCMPEKVSYRDPSKGTYYARSLTKILMANAHKMDLRSMMIMVEKDVGEETKDKKERQQPIVTTLGDFGNLYFNMEPDSN